MFTRKIIVIVVSAIILCNPVICMAEECTHKKKNEILHECQPFCCAVVRRVKDMNMLCIYLKLTLQEKRQYDRVKILGYKDDCKLQSHHPQSLGKTK
ncbi:hypothetical protein BS78_05G104100 [Paspalum vaginatum]|nr:hypothetical protein BS78_05G104100 [Paspalum vaginatum]